MCNLDYSLNINKVKKRALYVFLICSHQLSHFNKQVDLRNGGELLGWLVLVPNVYYFLTLNQLWKCSLKLNLRSVFI